MPEIRHKQLSYAIMGCAYKVHRGLGHGFPEAVYHKALCHELAKARIPFESERKADVWYDGVLCGEYRIDILVAGQVVLELKALDALCPQHMAQALTYLRASGADLAILLNFGTPRLESKRIVL